MSPDDDGKPPVDSPPSGSTPNSDPRPWTRVAGLGMELAGATLGCAGIGHLIDRYRGGTDGIGVGIGAFIGFALGMFRFIQKALQEVNNDPR